MKTIIALMLTTFSPLTASALPIARIHMNVRGVSAPPEYAAIHWTEIHQRDFNCRYFRNERFDCNVIADVPFMLPKWRFEIEGRFKTHEMEIQLFLVCPNGREIAINDTPLFSRRPQGKAFNSLVTSVDIEDAYFQCKSK